ncbi:DMT family transporter [Sinorhizobium medicae]|uniref:DMT family transporter n=1 Tax=Sinorhizobium medicae TaxID=110321 RepID=UPI0011A66845|nr:DMT family transporter [Sinorhizobium medicae]MDX0469021.1 EamA family transporter [Sinorhizobium medicae]MDX1176161.1 EamA family transporter [Sinorhizobium medicae]MDX1199081.1 EamA family transporter [Sinorhizobium medicae]MDX1222891.1 EamA family transporter [Sinorhizobium medicae]MDX1247702.1 EamA family transporter [Sinorhizobium medicae]
MGSSANFRGIVFMCLAMIGFACNDALVKSVTGAMNTGQIMFMRGLLTTLMVVVIAYRLGAFRPIRTILRPAILLRIAMEALASVTYISALGQIPLANASAIMQALPLAVTLGAALFLGEPVGWRRWAAIVVGFAGVLIVLRPGPEGFTVAALTVVACVFCTATRDLCTRRIGTDVPSLYITVTTSFVTTLVGAALIVPLGGWQPMSATSLSHIAGASVLLMLGYQTIVLAMREGEISVIAPFRYMSLLWSVTLGVVFFVETPDRWMLAGVAIIIGSGLYTFYRESKRGRRAVAQRALTGPLE